jgi:hypothetical protein
LWDTAPELGIGLEQPGDVGEVLLPLARAARGVLGGPDSSLKDVLELRHGQPQPQDLSMRSARDERRVPRVGPELNAQIRPGIDTFTPCGKRTTRKCFRSGSSADDTSVVATARSRSRLTTGSTKALTACPPITQYLSPDSERRAITRSRNPVLSAVTAFQYASASTRVPDSLLRV